MGRDGRGVKAASASSIEITFQYQGIRCRERIPLKPTPANLRRAEQHKAAIEHAIATGTFDAGFATALMSKDVSLFREQVGQAGTANRLTEVVAALWQETDRALPGSDFTEIYRYLAGN